MPYLFASPVVRDWTFADGARTPGEARFWAYFGAQPRGRSVLKIAGTWTEVDLPSTAQIQAADRIISIHGQLEPGYLAGGHVHTVTDTVGLELIADGFSVTDFEDLYTYPSLTLYPATNLYPSRP